MGVVPPQFPEGSELVARIRASEVEAFELVFFAYHEPLIRFAMRYVHSVDAAREIVQEAFLRLWDQRANLVVQTTLRGYLYRMVQHICVDELRRQEREQRGLLRVQQQHAVGEPLEMAGTTSGISDALLDDERRHAVWTAIQQLPVRRRLVMELRWQHHLSYAEIASILGISVKGVEAHVTRALAKLAADLEAFSE